VGIIATKRLNCEMQVSIYAYGLEIFCSREEEHGRVVALARGAIGVVEQWMDGYPGDLLCYSSAVHSR
jgi:hypothetical protein